MFKYNSQLVKMYISFIYPEIKEIYDNIRNHIAEGKCSCKLLTNLNSNFFLFPYRRRKSTTFTCSAVANKMFTFFFGVLSLKGDNMEHVLLLLLLCVKASEIYKCKY